MPTDNFINTVHDYLCGVIEDIERDESRAYKIVCDAFEAVLGADTNDNPWCDRVFDSESIVQFLQDVTNAIEEDSADYLLFSLLKRFSLTKVITL